MDQFTIGNLISGTWTAIKSNLFRFTLALALYFIIIGIAGGGIGFAMAGSPQDFNLGLFLIIIVISIGGIGVIYPLIMFGAVRTLRGSEWRFFEALSHALKVAIPVIIVTLLVGLGVGLGMLLLLVPGLILLVRWYVAVAVRVVEPVSVMEAMRRSADLTEGRRWEIFGAIIILFVIMFVLQSIFMVFNIMLVGAGSGFNPDPAAGGASLLPTIIGFVLMTIGQVIGMLVTVVAPSVAYYLLRVEKEGGETSQVANIFT